MSFRRDVVAGFGTMMAAFVAAHPTVITRHFRSRPPSVNTDMPYTFLELRPEGVTHVSGLRYRVMSPSIVAVFRLTDNGETTDVQDTAVDLLLDHFTLYPHIVAGTVWDELSVSDEAAPDGDSTFAAVRFTFANISIREGRPRRLAAHIVPPAATPEAIVNALQAVGLDLVGMNPLTATAETIVNALVAAGLISVTDLDAATATPEAICLLLIASSLMDP